MRVYFCTQHNIKHVKESEHSKVVLVSDTYLGNKRERQVTGGYFWKHSHFSERSTVRQPFLEP